MAIGVKIIGLYVAHRLVEFFTICLNTTKNLNFLFNLYIVLFSYIILYSILDSAWNIPLLGIRLFPYVGEGLELTPERMFNLITYNKN